VPNGGTQEYLAYVMLRQQGLLNQMARNGAFWCAITPIGTMFIDLLDENRDLALRCAYWKTKSLREEARMWDHESAEMDRERLRRDHAEAAEEMRLARVEP